VRFTAANAREMAAKAHAARCLRLAGGKLAGETFPQTPQVGPQEPAGFYVELVPKVAFLEERPTLGPTIGRKRTGFRTLERA